MEWTGETTDQHGRTFGLKLTVVGEEEWGGVLFFFSETDMTISGVLHTPIGDMSLSHDVGVFEAHVVSLMRFPVTGIGPIRGELFEQWHFEQSKGI